MSAKIRKHSKHLAKVSTVAPAQHQECSRTSGGFSKTSHSDTKRRHTRTITDNDNNSACLFAEGNCSLFDSQVLAPVFVLFLCCIANASDVLRPDVHSLALYISLERRLPQTLTRFTTALVRECRLNVKAHES